MSFSVLETLLQHCVQIYTSFSDELWSSSCSSTTLAKACPHCTHVEAQWRDVNGWKHNQGVSCVCMFRSSRVRFKRKPMQMLLFLVLLLKSHRPQRCTTTHTQTETLRNMGYTVGCIYRGTGHQVASVKRQTAHCYSSCSLSPERTPFAAHLQHFTLNLLIQYEFHQRFGVSTSLTGSCVGIWGPYSVHLTEHEACPRINRKRAGKLMFISLCCFHFNLCVHIYVMLELKTIKIYVLNRNKISIEANLRETNHLVR